MREIKLSEEEIKSIKKYLNTKVDKRIKGVYKVKKRWYKHIKLPNIKLPSLNK